MNFKKIRQLVNKNVYLDLEHASEDELRVNYDPADTEDTSWFVIIPKKYKIESDLAAIINAKAEIKLQAKSHSAFGVKKN